MSRIYRKYKKKTNTPGVKQGFIVEFGLIAGGISILLAAFGFGGFYMWLQTL